MAPARFRAEFFAMVRGRFGIIRGMVSVTHALDSADSGGAQRIVEGLPDGQREMVGRALELVAPLYAGKLLDTGEDVGEHARAVALIAASLRLDAETRAAALLFAAHDYLDDAPVRVASRFGDTVAGLVDGLRRLKNLHLATHAPAGARPPAVRQQVETLRKMLLALAADVRVVLLRLASRTQTLRFLTGHPGEARSAIARESLDVYAPLANRLGVWQLKWELEDLSFRFLEPETYKRIARMLDERRVEREQFIARAIGRLESALEAAGIRAEVTGRPKHIYSIYAKMRGKRIDFADLRDVRALRVLVGDVKDCYAALGVIHQLWQPIPREFDDYIAHPKGNDYRSLHTAVLDEEGRAIEVQVRTLEMHRHAELGVAAHWRYKEAGTGAKADDRYDERIALLRRLLSWRDEVTDASDWVEQYRRAELDDTIYVLTPQGRVIDLPRGATPIDFAYRVHTDLGHRCRGARVDGQLVPLNRPLESGQRVEVIVAKQGGPSRDWLSAQQAYLVTPHARTKVRRWFALLEEQETLAKGRSFVTRELQREGQSQTNIDELARRLGFASADALYLAAGRAEVGPRQVQVALRGDDGAAEPELATRRGRSRGDGQILVVGVGKLLTQLGRCCRPAPPDRISGFVTRGRGVSIHRAGCTSFAEVARRAPERVIEAQWGDQGDALYPVDMVVEAHDRQGLLRDISEVLSREKINVVAANTQSRAGMARMSFTVEIASVALLDRVLGTIRELRSVTGARRG
jgi:GTP pyrophosphokinase